MRRDLLHKLIMSFVGLETLLLGFHNLLSLASQYHACNVHPVHLQQDSQTVAMQPPDHNNMPVQVITALIIHLTVVILHTLHLPALIPMFLLHHHI